MADRKGYDTAVFESCGRIRAKDLCNIDTQVDLLVRPQPVQEIAEYQGSGLAVHEIFGVSSTLIP